VDLPPPADENADLPAQGPGQLGQVPGEFVCEDAVGREFSPVEAFYLPDLVGLEARQVSVELVDVSRSSSGLLELVRADLFFHGVEKIGPELGAEGGDYFFDFFPVTLGAGKVRRGSVDLVEHLEDLAAGLTLVVIKGHGQPP